MQAGLVGAASLKAIPTINRFAAIRLKGNLGVYTTTGANGIKHLALRPIVATATTTTIASTTVATTATAAITTTATAALLGRIPARFAFARGLEALGFVKLLLFLGKFKISATGGTGDMGRHISDL
jgi:hypothetical protein